MDKTKLARDLFDAFAQVYQDKFMEMDLHHDSFDLFCEALPKEGARIFEIACGPGNITRYLLRQRPDLNILGIDLAPKMVALAKQNNPTADFQVMDCRAIHQIKESFDAVMCGFALPYISKEETLQLIADVALMLETNGVFYLSTMEDDYSKSGLKGPSSGGEQRVYMYYHQADYLIEALKLNGFKLLHTLRKNYPEADGSTTVDLVLIARKE